MECIKDLKSFFYQNNGKNKSCLLWLYSIGSGTADFIYNNDIHVEFHRIDRKNVEFVAAQVYISLDCLGISKKQILEAEVAMENYILIHFHPYMNQLIKNLQNTSKHTRERGMIEIQRFHEAFLKRNGVIYKEETNEIGLGLYFQLPLINMTFLCGKNAYKLVTDVLKLAEQFVAEFKKEVCLEWLAIYKNQQEIRTYMKENDYICFIADGSVIPRKNGTQEQCQTLFRSVVRTTYVLLLLLQMELK